jgi:hypothetical protein
LPRLRRPTTRKGRERPTLRFSGSGSDRRAPSSGEYPHLSSERPVQPQLDPERAPHQWVSPRDVRCLPLLLEIGTEELPSSFVDAALAALPAIAADAGDAGDALRGEDPGLPPVGGRPGRAAPPRIAARSICSGTSRPKMLGAPRAPRAVGGQLVHDSVIDERKARERRKGAIC